MNTRRFFAHTTMFAVMMCGSLCCAQEPSDAAKPDAVDRIKLFDSLEQTSDRDNSPAALGVIRSTDQLRQARALERANQRISRMEYNLWIGHDPLRPQWSAIPMTQSRYAPRQFHVPIYVYGY